VPQRGQGGTCIYAWVHGLGNLVKTSDAKHGSVPEHQALTGILILMRRILREENAGFCFRSKHVPGPNGTVPVSSKSFTPIPRVSPGWQWHMEAIAGARSIIVPGASLSAHLTHPHTFPQLYGCVKCAQRLAPHTIMLATAAWMSSVLNLKPLLGMPLSLMKTVHFHGRSSVFVLATTVLA
jgi:hypothetical protein